MFRDVERRGGAGLVVVLEEAREFLLVIESRTKMFAHRARVAFAQAVVEALVVGVVEALLLHVPFAVPIHLGHETEVRRLLAHAARRFRPEQWRAYPPSPLEDIWQHQHRHVAADAVALS